MSTGPGIIRGEGTVEPPPPPRRPSPGGGEVSTEPSITQSRLGFQLWSWWCHECPESEFGINTRDDAQRRADRHMAEDHPAPMPDPFDVAIKTLQTWRDSGAVSIRCDIGNRPGPHWPELNGGEVLHMEFTATTPMHHWRGKA